MLPGTFQERLSCFPILRTEDGFEVRTNGGQEFVETEDYLVLRPTHETAWQGYVKTGDGFAEGNLVATGERLFDVVEETRLTVRALPSFLDRLEQAVQTLQRLSKDTRELPEFVIHRGYAAEHLMDASHAVEKAVRWLEQE